jgi:hypothetical protein
MGQVDYYRGKKNEGGRRVCTRESSRAARYCPPHAHGTEGLQAERDESRRGAGAMGKGDYVDKQRERVRKGKGGTG